MRSLHLSFSLSLIVTATSSSLPSTRLCLDADAIAEYGQTDKVTIIAVRRRGSFRVLLHDQLTHTPAHCNTELHVEVYVIVSAGIWQIE